MLDETLRILMPAKARAVAKKTPVRKPAAKKATKPAAPKLGVLPEWNLADLYPAMDAPELKRDLERGAAECAAFE
jgi:oligoendopeptidase F